MAHITYSGAIIYTFVAPPNTPQRLHPRTTHIPFHYVYAHRHTASAHTPVLPHIYNTLSPAHWNPRSHGLPLLPLCSMRTPLDSPWRKQKGQRARESVLVAFSECGYLLHLREWCGGHRRGAESEPGIWVVGGGRLRTWSGKRGKG